jgi:hypothetical protein
VEAMCSCVGKVKIPAFSGSKTYKENAKIKEMHKRKRPIKKLVTGLIFTCFLVIFRELIDNNVKKANRNTVQDEYST